MSRQRCCRLLRPFAYSFISGRRGMTQMLSLHINSFTSEIDRKLMFSEELVWLNGLSKTFNWKLMSIHSSLWCELQQPLMTSFKKYFGNAKVVFGAVSDQSVLTKNVFLTVHKHVSDFYLRSHMKLHQVSGFLVPANKRLLKSTFGY